ncbi:MAG: ACT domain-containing protein [Eubacteriales bacterium]|nr:ACT domain-containing protein [Eubacteriales bacterium]
MEKVNFYLINSNIMPDIYKKVIKAKSLLASGEAKNVAQASKMAGVSRSAYYKYKDAIFEYHGDDSSDTATINAKLKDNAGVLSSLMNELYKAGANVLSVNQSVPIHSVADVSVTVRIAEMTISKDELLKSVKEIDGVNSVVLS